MSATVDSPIEADVAAAYRWCGQITRSEAGNFWAGIRLLEPAKLRALSAVYAVARRADDIADGDQPAAVKLAALARLRADLSRLPGTSGDAVLVALADAGRRFPIPLDAFGELIDGCEADVRGTRYATFDDLVGYCRQVAGSIGRLSVGVFGAARQEEAAPLADSLGVALQLTNILRDLAEDRRNGRIYLPAEDLRRFGVDLSTGGPGEPLPRRDALARLVEFEVDRARRWYAAGLPLLPLLDRRSAACCAAMAGIYARLLDRIGADPLATVSTRVSVPAWEKAVIAARSLAWGRP